jgi:hypothetical protein
MCIIKLRTRRTGESTLWMRYYYFNAAGNTGILPCLELYFNPQTHCSSSPELHARLWSATSALDKKYAKEHSYIFNCINRKPSMGSLALLAPSCRIWTFVSILILFLSEVNPSDIFRSLTYSVLKITAFWDIAMNHPADGGSTHLWNVGLLQREYI